MVHESVRDIAQRFAERWSLGGERAPVLKLDFSWPSLGVVDLIVTQFERSDSTAREFDELVRGIAAYIGVMADGVWSSLGCEVAVNIGDNGVAIVAAGGTFLAEEEQVTIAIEHVLRELFEDSSEPVLPVFNDFSRIVPPGISPVGLFAAGVIVGLTPFAEGPWASQPRGDMHERLLKVQKILAEQCSQRYGRLFDNEQLGQVAELYLNDLVYPPLLCEEELPAVNAVTGLQRFRDQYNVSTEQMLTLTSNLARSSDEVLSCAGLAYAAALSDQLAPEIIAASQAKANWSGILRETMYIVRERLGQRGDWMKAADALPEDAERFDLEFSLGFLPWVRLPRTRVSDKSLSTLFQALAIYDYDEALKEIERLAAETPGDIDLQLQRVYFYLLQGDFEKCDRVFRTLITEPGSERDARLFNLWGLSDLSRSDPKSALQHFQLAFELMDAKSLDQMEISNNLGWALMLNERWEEALQVLDRSIEHTLIPVTPLLNKAYVLLTLGRDEDAEVVEDRLLKLAPLDPRVVKNLVLSALAQN